MISLCDLSDLGIEYFLSETLDVSLHKENHNISLEFLLNNKSIDLDTRDRKLKEFRHNIPANFRLQPIKQSVTPPPPPPQRVIADKNNQPFSKQDTPAIIVKPKSNLERKIIEAEKLCSECTALFELIEILETFQTGTQLQKLALETVFFDGSMDADLLIIGDSPDRDDEDNKRPFSSPISGIMREALERIDKDYLSKTAFFYLMPWRNVIGRIGDDEYRLLLPFIRKAIDILRPKKMIFAGSIVTQYLLDKNTSLISLFGTTESYKYLTGECPALITSNPSYVMAQDMGIMRKKFWFDIVDFLKKEDS